MVWWASRRNIFYCGQGIPACFGPSFSLHLDVNESHWSNAMDGTRTSPRRCISIRPMDSPMNFWRLRRGISWGAWKSSGLYRISWYTRCEDKAGMPGNGPTFPNRIVHQEAVENPKMSAIAYRSKMISFSSYFLKLSWSFLLD